jgi:PAS domain S-box-containing protein
LEQVHSLLKRQLRRFFGNQIYPRDLQEFINAINNAYLEFDIDRQMLERSLEMSSNELLEANAEMRELNRTLKMISECNQAVVRARDEMSLLRDVCRIIIEIGGYLMAWIGFAEQDEEKTVRPVAHYGHEDGYLEKVKISWADTEFGRGPTGRAIRTGKPAFAEYYLGKSIITPWYVEAIKRNYQSSVAIPLIVDEHAFGTLNIHADKPGKFKHEEVELLMELAGDLSYGIMALRTREDHKQAEVALQDSEAHYRAIVEAFDGLIYICSQDYRVEFMNQRALDRTGYNAIGETCYKVLHDLESVCPWCITERVFKGEVVRGEVLSPKDSRWYDVVNTPIHHADDSMSQQAMFADITERKHAEEERKILEERLQRAEKMEALGTLAGGVAHDLNNVLGIVVGYSELLLDKIDESSPIRSHVMNIMQGGDRAAAIVQDLLTLARRGVHTEKVVNLNSIVVDFQKSPEVVKLSSFHPNVHIMTNLESDLLNIIGSPVHLRKTLMNLVSNAAEAMPNGGVLAIATNNQYLDRPVHGYDDVTEGDYVVLSVSDTGEGIPAADQKRIFEPFYTKKVMGRSGTGLGLAVVWGTVKDHKGYINVQSQEGKGTIFTLYFPITREEISEEQISISVSEYMGRGESILVVDDVKGQRELATQMLGKLNYNVSNVSSGEAAVEFLKINKVDLIILDMIMDPGIDGLDTYKRVLEINPKQKAIIVSGFSETDRVNQAQALGVGAYVKKPYVLEKLGFAVRKELDTPI